MDKPTPDPAKLLGYWEEWERGETPPGKVLSNLKTGGVNVTRRRTGTSKLARNVTRSVLLLRSWLVTFIFFLTVLSA